MAEKKLIVVFGATGAQGIPVIDALLVPKTGGQPSPYSVRAITRNATSRRALLLKEKGAELIQGSVEDFDVVAEALRGAYGAWVNIDGFTIGEKREMFSGMRIYEIAKRAGLRHFVWSNLDYVSKLANYNPAYRCEHYDGKGRVLEFLKAQESDTSEQGMTWSSVTTGPYMEMLKIEMLGPLNRRADGTFVFASPVGDGHVPMIALRDLGFFARYTFDNRSLVSGRDLEVASRMVRWDGPDGLVETFRRVTGLKAVYVRQTVEEWMQNFVNTDRPLAADNPEGVTWKENFSGFWRCWRDDIVKRDMKWIRSVNPNGHTLETWMRENKYDARKDLKLFRWQEDGLDAGRDRLSLNEEVVKKL